MFTAVIQGFSFLFRGGGGLLLRNKPSIVGYRSFNSENDIYIYIHIYIWAMQDIDVSLIPKP